MVADLSADAAHTIPRFIRRGVSPHVELDWRTFAAVALLLALTSLLAALVPTHRAATVDPIIALRGGS